MTLLGYLTALTALTATVTALPASVFKRGTFSVKQVPNGLKSHYALQMKKAYHKFGGVMPTPVQNVVANVEAALAGSATGSVAAVPESYDVEYLCEVTVGGTLMNLNFDTGSADLWVYSTLQSSSQTRGHAVYNVNHGKKISGASWQISYGDGSGASGLVYKDSVTVGGVTATSQAVEAAQTVSAQFVADTQDDGLVGLAFSKINTVSPTPQTTFFDTVKSQLAAPIFAAVLKKGSPGSFDFGYIDSSKYTGSIGYAPVDSSRGFWQITMDGYKVGTASAVASSAPAIADTGTTLMYIPQAYVAAYYAKVPNAKNSASDGGYVFPCSTTLPDFYITIAGVNYIVPGSYINYQPTTTGGSTCFGGVQNNDGLQGLSILGDIFLKGKYVVFDSTPKLGIALQK